MATPGRVYDDIVSKEKLVKELKFLPAMIQICCERIKAESHDGRMIPPVCQILNAKQDGKSKFFFTPMALINIVSLQLLVHLDFA